MTYKTVCSIEDAPRFADWILNRGGVAVWHSLDLGRADVRWSTPALTDGRPSSKPHWSATNEPVLIITDPTLIEVITYRVYKRFHVALRMGSQGLSLKLTDSSTRKLDKYLTQAGDESTYRFDYGTQEAIILQKAGSISLAEWLAAHQ